MSNSWGELWSDNPNAPLISYLLYVDEKSFFAGLLFGAILYGVVLALFFQCMNALLDPAYRATTWGIKWGLVAHTTVTFSFVTIYTAMYLDLQSLSFIDNREFPGGDLLPPGPIGYQLQILPAAISVVPTVLTILNNGLADGLLFYRYSGIYGMNYWAIAFPGLVYLASLAMGIAFIYQGSQPLSTPSRYIALNNYGISYYAITASLNLFLTLTIILRLFLHRRKIRNVMGATAGVGKTYTAVIVMLVESYAIYSVTFLVFLGLWGAKSPVANAFFPILVQTQAIAPFLITLRVASQNVAASKATFSGSDSSIRFRSYAEPAEGNGTHLGGQPAIQLPVGLGVAHETTVDVHHEA